MYPDQVDFKNIDILAWIEVSFSNILAKMYPFLNISGHYVCIKCREKCKCGSIVGKAPSKLASKVLEGLPYFCYQFKFGCQEILWPEELEEHEKNCKFRKVFCPTLDCQDKKIMFKDIMAHLNNKHKDTVFR